MSRPEVCFSCYKLQLSILKEEVSESTDIGFVAVIEELRGEVMPLEAVDSMQAAISRAITETFFMLQIPSFNRKHLSYLLSMNTFLQL